MKIGFRIPSITKRIATRTSIKRVVRHNLGLKAPRGLGCWVKGIGLKVLGCPSTCSG